MTIKDLVKETFINLDKKNILPTPGEYSKEFYKIAAREHFDLKDFDSLSHLVALIQKVISPNIPVKDIDDPMMLFSLDLKNHPEKIFDKEVQKKIEIYLNAKLLKDTRDFELKTKNVSMITQHLGTFLDNTINNTDTNTKNVSTIISKIQNQKNENIENIEHLKKELVDIANKFEHMLEESKSKLKNGKNSIQNISEELSKIRQHIQDVHSHTILDHETNLPTIGTFKKELQYFESNFLIHQQNFAIVSIEIDYFNNILAKHGKNGIAYVLSTFATLINSSIRKNDIIIKDEVSSFLCLINTKDQKSIENFIVRLKELIQKSEFKYDNTGISITFGAAIALRSKYISADKTFEQLRNYQVKAKHAGKNITIIDNIPLKS